MSTASHNVRGLRPRRQVREQTADLMQMEGGGGGICVAIHNHQRTRAVDLRELRRVTRALLEEFLTLKQAELTVILVDAREMTRLNETFLQHAGSTDVITFDYSERGMRDAERLHGDVFVCVDDAMRQARQFRATWAQEVVRYLVHGVLHLLGHDDRRAPARRAMKREENRLLRALSRSFPPRWLARKPPRRVPLEPR